MKLTRRATRMQEASIITEQVFAAYASELFSPVPLIRFK